VEVRDGTGLVGVVDVRLHSAGRRDARNEAKRDCVLGKEGSDDVVDVGIEVDEALRLDVDGAGDAVRIALRSSSRSAALSTVNGGQSRITQGNTCKSQFLR